MHKRHSFTSGPVCGPLLDLCGLHCSHFSHFWTCVGLMPFTSGWVGMMPFTSGPAWAWCLTSGPVWASLLSFLDLGLMPFTGPVWASFAFTSGPVCPWEALKKTPCQPICCLFLCAAFSFERPAPTRGLFPQEAFSHHRKMPQ